MRSYILRGPTRTCSRCFKAIQAGALTFDTLDPKFAGAVWCSVECCDASLDAACAAPAKSES